METNEKKETGISDETKGKRKWGARIINFLAMGGFILVLIAAVAIAIVISILFK